MIDRTFFFFQAEDGIRDLVRSRGLGDVYKRQDVTDGNAAPIIFPIANQTLSEGHTLILDITAFDLSLIHI